MHPTDSASTFENALAASGLTVAELDAQQALAQMLSFYRDVRAEGCDIAEEEDTLIWRWKVGSQTESPVLLVEIIRSFIEPGTEDEDGMSQLCLSLQFELTDTLRALGKGGSLWCGSPQESEAFERSVLDSHACQALASLKPTAVELVWFLE